MHNMNKKFQNLIENLVKYNTHCYFISPHLDDAALSAGGLISYLAGKVPVTVINVFTEVHNERPTLSAKAFLKQSGVKKADKLFTKRRKEDSKVFNKIGVKVVNLGFIDVLWRKKEYEGWFRNSVGKLLPELKHTYPTYRFHAGLGKVSDKDRKLTTDIKKRLEDIVGKRKNSMVICPVGIGKHVDHVIVRAVASDTFKKIIYWSDFNYSMEWGGENKFIDKKNLKLAYFDRNLLSKRRLIAGYKSQIFAIFPHGKIPIFPDFYYI